MNEIFGKVGNMPGQHVRSHFLLKTSSLAISALIAGAAAPAYAQAASAAAEPQVAGADAGDIVVTAQRRSERLIDVPYNISAVSGDDLATAGATSANDLTKVVAGLGNFSAGPADAFGENNFSMRGLRTDVAGFTGLSRMTVSSVSTYYGDVPVFFNLLLKDLERVEVLRGPQGTLYGSGAQAGAIRFIPNRPSFNGISGEVNASAGITQGAGGLNGSVDGVINLPLAENLAVRVSGAYVRQAGFIDQVNLFQLDSNGAPIPSVAGDATSGPVIAPIMKDTNSWDQWMVRGAVRYQPTDWLDMEVAYLHQETSSNDFQVSNPDYQGGERDLSSGFWANAPYQSRPGGKYQNTQSMLQPVKAKIDLVSGTVALDLGFAEFSSITSYYDSKTTSHTDGGQAYVNPVFNFAVGYNHYPRFTADVGFSGREKGFTQELRLVSQGDSAFSYVLGAYYQKQTKKFDYNFLSPGLQAFSDAVCAVPGLHPDCQPGANPGLKDVIFTANQDFLNKEQAVFGELTYRITDRWQVTGGFRVFKVTQDFSNYQTYPFFGAPYGDGVTEPISQGASLRGGFASASDQVFKANTSYELDPDNKVYFTFAQGFRRGGANPLSTTGPTASLPEFLSFKPDFANNYEIGIKGRTLGRRLSYALSLYRVDLKGFQFNGLTPAFYATVFNGEEAKTKGLELEFSFKATPNLTLSGSYSYTDTDVPKTTVIRDLAATSLLDGFQDSDIIVNPNATVLAGAILPGVSKHSANAAIDYEIPLGGSGRVLLHANASYRSKQNNMIAVDSPNFAVIPEVFMADARITYDSGKGWTGSLFVTNLTNALGVSGLQGVQTQNVAEAQALIYAGKLIATPRTFGLSLHYGF
jgi:outer membrane receptor protein involved in Fe transport